VLRPGIRETHLSKESHQTGYVLRWAGDFQINLTIGGGVAKSSNRRLATAFNLINA
jgi:hypothetical protein